MKGCPKAGLGRWIAATRILDDLILQAISSWLAFGHSTWIAYLRLSGFGSVLKSENDLMLLRSFVSWVHTTE